MREVGLEDDAPRRRVGHYLLPQVVYIHWQDNIIIIQKTHPRRNGLLDELVPGLGPVPSFFVVAHEAG